MPMKDTGDIWGEKKSNNEPMGPHVIQGTPAFVLVSSAVEQCWRELSKNTCLVIIVFRLHLIQENYMAGRELLFLFLFGSCNFNVKIKKDELLALTSL